jgi:undecaprenyl-diphosphatase
MDNPSADAPDPRKATSHVQDTHERFARLRRFANPEQRHRLLLLGGCVALLMVSFLATLAVFVPVLPLDIAVTREFQETQSQWFEQMMYGVSIFGYTPWAEVTVVVGTLLVGLVLGWKEGLFLLSATIAQGLINAALKFIIGRPRPLASVVDVLVPEHGNSFPSGHVMFYTMFFGLLAFLGWTRFPRAWFRWLITFPSLMLVAVVGAARIYLGSHWLSDVLAAYLLGFVLLGLAIEWYVAHLAPRTPAEQSGLVQKHDQNAATDVVPGTGEPGK